MKQFMKGNTRTKSSKINIKTLEKENNKFSTKLTSRGKHYSGMGKYDSFFGS